MPIGPPKTTAQKYQIVPRRPSPETPNGTSARSRIEPVDHAPTVDFDPRDRSHPQRSLDAWGTAPGAPLGRGCDHHTAGKYHRHEPRMLPAIGGP
jgi:hypothetical protein